jgi:hypothetical protein
MANRSMAVFNTVAHSSVLVLFGMIRLSCSSVMTPMISSLFADGERRGVIYL